MSSVNNINLELDMYPKEFNILTKTELIKFDCNPPEHILYRYPEIQMNYDNHKKKLKQNGITPWENIIKSYFKSKQNYCIIRNNFPYATSPGINHWCIWWRNISNLPNCLHNQYGRNYINKLLQARFNKRLEHGIDYIYFENKADNKSIPELRHIHIFSITNKF